MYMPPLKNNQFMVWLVEKCLQKCIKKLQQQKSNQGDYSVNERELEEKKRKDRSIIESSKMCGLPLTYTHS